MMLQRAMATLCGVCLMLAAGTRVQGEAAPGSASSGATTPLYDVVIRNGRVLDGAGNPWVRADVAIKNGRFAKVGRVEGRGVREIDAQGDDAFPRAGST